MEDYPVTVTLSVTLSSLVTVLDTSSVAVIVLTTAYTVLFNPESKLIETLLSPF